MIKINLLPSEGARKVKKKSDDQTQLVIAGGSIILTILFCFYFFWYVPKGTLEHLQAEQVRAQQELQRLKVKVKVVEDFERNTAKLRKKNQIIKNLRKAQGRPVHLLDDLSASLPDRVWLISLTEKKGEVDLVGKALSNADIVDYISNLKRFPAFQEVQLNESRTSQEKNVSIYKFKIKVKTST